MAPTDLAWLAAIIEGEGTYVLRRAFGVLRVVMTDQDVIERLPALSGVGLVRALPPRLPHHKPPWAWEVMRYEAAALVTAATAPFMLQRRRERIGIILDRCGQPLPDPIVLQGGTAEAWAWIAGLIEGEGWIGPSPLAKYHRAAVNVSSTDRDVLERLQELTG